MQHFIAPSILSADFSKLGEEVAAVSSAGADWIHLDVMDGSFVPAITFGPAAIKSIRGSSDKLFDAHLMIANPDNYIQEFADAGAQCITVHSEACLHLDRNLERIRSMGIMAGVAVNPATSIEFLPFVIDKLDLVLIMTVNPGFGGQSYLPLMDDKIKQARAMIGERRIRLQVDGGINDKTIKQAADAGADTFVAGSYVFGGNYSERIETLRKAVGN